MIRSRLAVISRWIGLKGIVVFIFVGFFVVGIKKFTDIPMREMHQPGGPEVWPRINRPEYGYEKFFVVLFWE